MNQGSYMSEIGDEPGLINLAMTCQKRPDSWELVSLHGSNPTTAFHGLISLTYTHGQIIE